MDEAGAKHKAAGGVRAVAGAGGCQPPLAPGGVPGPIVIARGGRLFGPRTSAKPCATMKPEGRVV